MFFRPTKAEIRYTSYMDPNNQNPDVLPAPQPPTPSSATVDGSLPRYEQPAAHSGPQNPYNFIMDTDHKRKKKLVTKPNSFRSRMFWVIGGGLIAIIAVIGLSSFINSAQNEKTSKILSLVPEQQEIIRVADLGVVGSKDLSIQAWAETTKLSVASQQKTLTTYLKKNNVTTEMLAINSKINKNTDASLKTATSDNRFDDEFTTTLKALLTSYADNLKNDYDGAGANGKKILSDSYKSTAQLLK